MPQHDATRFVTSVFGGLADPLRDSPHDLESLAGDYATPGGVNEQFAAAMREARMPEIVGRSLDDVLGRLLAPLR